MTVLSVVLRKFRSAVKRARRFARAFLLYLYNHLLTHFPSYLVRRIYLQRILRFDIHSTAAIHMGCFFTGDDIRIGADSVINRRCYLDGRGGLEIGESVSVSPEVYLVSASHDVHSDKFLSCMRSVLIQNRAWLGARAMVLPGVVVGEGAVLGAGAVAARSIPARAICVGNPARVVGERRGELNYSLRYFPWFDTDLG